jgi:hypothetical protein
MHYHYVPEDAAELIRSGFSVGIGSPGFLADMVLAGREYASDLAQYPRVFHDALARHYMSLRGMARLDIWLLHDLLSGHGVGGQIFAAWFAALSPHPLYRPLLLDKVKPPHHQYALYLALQAINELEGAAPTESSIALAEIRSSLLTMPQPDVRLRLVPTEEQTSRLEEERQRIAAIYRREGADAARAGLKGTLLAYYRMDHEQWLRAGSPSAEDYLADLAKSPA